MIPMRQSTILRLSIIALGALAICSVAPAAELVIRPNPKADWRADVENVQAVLDSAAAPLWRQFPRRELKPILVEPQGGPIVLFRRGPDGEYLVRLDTGETYWAQYAFQFAHELGHILCNYQERPHRNKWLEESLCETASLFALRAMSRTWRKNPPYPNWRSFAPALRQYADERIEGARLPERRTLADWFADHEAALYQNATRRSLNLVVAAQLLPLLEQKPQHWEAVTWLNAAANGKSQTLGEFLSAWHAEVPQRHRGFIRRIAGKFGVALK